MSVMGNMILDIEDAVVDVMNGFSNETFQDIANRLNIPLEWVEDTYEGLCEY